MRFFYAQILEDHMTDEQFKQLWKEAERRELDEQKRNK